MYQTKADIIDHLNADHGGTELTSRASKTALQAAHADDHAGLDCDHEHDPWTGQPTPTGDTLTYH